jgi:hypothetical protein
MSVRSHYQVDMMDLGRHLMDDPERQRRELMEPRRP